MFEPGRPKPQRIGWQNGHGSIVFWMWFDHAQRSPNKANRNEVPHMRNLGITPTCMGAFESTVNKS